MHTVMMHFQQVPYAQPRGVLRGLAPLKSSSFLILGGEKNSNLFYVSEMRMLTKTIYFFFCLPSDGCNLSIFGTPVARMVGKYRNYYKNVSMPLFDAFGPFFTSEFHYLYVFRIQSKDQVLVTIDPEQCKEPDHSIQLIPVALYIVDDYGGYNKDLINEMKRLLEDENLNNYTLPVSIQSRL